MACPADRFRPSAHTSDGLTLWAPADLEPVSTAVPGQAAAPAMARPASWPDAIEIERVVPASGNMTVGPQQFWLGTSRVGQTVRFWIDTTTVHLSIGGWRIKTVPSRLSAVDLARLRTAGARPAGPPPAGPAPGPLAASSCVEVQRLVNASGIITLATRSSWSAPRWPGSAPGSAWTARSCTSSPRTASCGAPCPAPSRPASGTSSRASGWPVPQPLPAASLVIQRKVSSRGGIQVARQRIQVGLPHAGQVVTIELADTTLRIIDNQGELIATVPRNSTGEISRFKAHGTRQSR